MSTSGFGFGRGPFDDFDDVFTRFFGSGPPSAQRRPRQVDVGGLLSERARELVARAQQAAVRDGSEELGARHLLAAALEVDSTRRMLTEAGADVDALGRRLGVGLLLSLFAAGSHTALALLLSGIAYGAVFGAVFGFIGHALTGGRRDFTSRSQIVAGRYDVVADAQVAGEAEKTLVGLNRREP
ncbi:Clp protease N-terminal domain-containing protein [Streptomyces prasinus]|uniref:Clp protease N-terminal domain-containing protein n=1 Tax=Streptomyces prasinus TaxID=67345 RepID=UPI00099E9C4F|nr:Clp protease N-terminal domain-containing protein [Streptomyces prasinus]